MFTLLKREARTALVTVWAVGAMHPLGPEDRSGAHGYDDVLSEILPKVASLISHQSFTFDIRQ